MSDLSLNLAPNAPWIALTLASLVLLALAVWAYRIAIPPVPALARRALSVLRAFALLALIWLLAQPVLERLGGEAARVVVLRDRSPPSRSSTGCASSQIRASSANARNTERARRASAGIGGIAMR